MKFSLSGLGDCLEWNSTAYLQVNLNLEVDVQVRTVLGTLFRISSRSGQRMVLSWMSSLIHLPWWFVPASYFGPWNRSRSCLRPNKTNSTKWKSNIFQLLCRPLSVFVLLHLFVSARVVIYSFHCEQGLAVSCLYTWLLVQSTHSPNPT